MALSGAIRYPRATAPTVSEGCARVLPVPTAVLAIDIPKRSIVFLSAPRSRRSPECRLLRSCAARGQHRSRAGERTGDSRGSSVGRLHIQESDAGRGIFQRPPGTDEIGGCLQGMATLLSAEECLARAEACERAVLSVRTIELRTVWRRTAAQWRQLAMDAEARVADSVLAGLRAPAIPGERYRRGPPS